jgi:hypothetical protein
MLLPETGNYFVFRFPFYRGKRELSRGESRESRTESSTPLAVNNLMATVSVATAFPRSAGRDGSDGPVIRDATQSVARGISTRSVETRDKHYKGAEGTEKRY